MTPRRLCTDRGSGAVELVILVPVLLAVMCFVAFAGRTTVLKQKVEQAGAAGARAASLRTSPDSARRAAEGAVRWSLVDSATSCADLTIDVDTHRLQPGGVVAVTVACTVSAQGLAGFPLPADRTVTSRAAQVIDTHGDQP